MEERNKRKFIQLTGQQLQVLGMTARGFSQDQIADKLGICKRTVAFHLLCCRERLGAVSTAQAIYYAVFFGLIPLDVDFMESSMSRGKE